MRRQISICDTVVSRVKVKITSGLSLQAISRITGVSYYTVWAISRGKYDTKEPLRPKVIVDEGIFQVDKHENWLM